MSKRTSPPSPGRRHLRREELALWRAVTRHIKPFAGRELAPEAVSEPVAPAPEPPPQPSRPRPGATAAAPRVVTERPLQTVLPMRKVAPQATIDLHGLRQVEAHAALSRFIRLAHVKGLRTVLVITGKGGGAAETWWEERGVLRRNLPHWLDTPEMKTFVLGFQEAARQHGGAGAYYVQLRKPSRGSESR